MIKGSFAVLILLAVAFLAGAGDAPPAAARVNTSQRWIWFQGTLSSEPIFKEASDLVVRAAKDGYTGITISDYRLPKAKMYPGFGAKLAAFRKICDDAKMQLIMGCTPIGYADAILANDPNLAESLPAREQVFAVKNGKLVPDDEGVKLVNGSFEELLNGAPVGWKISKDMTIDNEVKYEGKPSLRLDDSPKSSSRISQMVKVKPWHSYHISVMIKTENYTAKDNRIQPYSPKLDYVLAWQPPTLEKTRDWTRVHCTFSSLEADEIMLAIGHWGPGSKDGGKIWFADVRLEPAGFCNIVRRDGCPLKVTSEDGKTTYTEGKDFSPIKDPKLGNDPNPGYYTLWHDVPDVTIPEGSGLKEGQKVLIGYNFAVTSGKPGQMNVCLSEPKLYQLVEDEIKFIKENARPDIYFMQHDEIRILGWDDSCASRNLTCGQILADNVSKCAAIIKKVDPGKPIFVWNDCFDKFHLAQPAPFTHYLCKGRGALFGSWEGLPKDVGIVNWKPEDKQSVDFFAELGRQQVFSCFEYEKFPGILKQSGKADGVVGVMYCTWSKDYGKNVESYIDEAKKWEQSNGGYGK